MNRIVRRGEEDERGVVIIIVAVAMVVLLGLIAIAIDGSFGFVQNRRAQNATDFAAYAAAQQLNDSTYCNGTTALTMQEVTALIQKLISENDSGIGTSWSAQYVSSTGTVIPNSTFTPTSSDTPEPPPGACGVTVVATQTWSPFFAGVLGIHQLGGYASSKVSNTATGQPFSIIALNKVGPHEILGGGTGTFVVSGDIVLNTNVQPTSHGAGRPTTTVGRRHRRQDRQQPLHVRHHPLHRHLATARTCGRSTRASRTTASRDCSIRRLRDPRTHPRARRTRAVTRPLSCRPTR